MVLRFFCSEQRSCPDFDSVKIPTALIRIERTIDQAKGPGSRAHASYRSGIPVLVKRTRTLYRLRETLAGAIRCQAAAKGVTHQGSGLRYR
jgi:hypothetical protein